ncbi:MAG: carbohydrate-binding domain-containing protein, partial [Candidatus Bipolaricaulis sp.]
MFSADDLVITGTGSLTVNGNHSNGIQSKDDLALSGATVTVAAVNDGIKGRDSITVSEATITIRA